MIKINKGLDVPISGEVTEEIIEEGKRIKHVALLSSDYIGMKPTMLIKLGDIVKIGTPLFKDKKREGVIFTSPASGEVVEVNRGARRAFQSLVIKIDEVEENQDFESYKSVESGDLSRQVVVDLLVESGLWISFRERPFSRSPLPESTPSSIFVTATNTNPLCFDPEVMIMEHFEDFNYGLEILSNLTDGNINLCLAGKSQLRFKVLDKIKIHKFEGKHPAGNAGTHIHYIDPVSETKKVWHLNYRDVIAIGKLFSTGRIWNKTIVALTGPKVQKPILVRTRIGAHLGELLNYGMRQDDARVISGSILSGHEAAFNFNFLGRFHHQVTILEEGDKRELMGWAMPGFNKFSVKNVFASNMMPWKKFKYDTDQFGGHRAIVPIGSYEKVMPGQFLPTQLLKSLCSNDIEQAISLGCLELDEEDLALCTFVCPGKIDFGKILRENLDFIEKEG